MEELKQRIAQAQAGDVQRLLSPGSLAFQPREAAFTALVTQCARAKAWEKALAVFNALRQAPGMTANTISYSAVISACSSSGGAAAEPTLPQLPDMLHGTGWAAGSCPVACQHNTP